MQYDAIINFDSTICIPFDSFLGTYRNFKKELYWNSTKTAYFLYIDVDDNAGGIKFIHIKKSVSNNWLIALKTTQATEKQVVKARL